MAKPTIPGSALRVFLIGGVGAGRPGAAAVPLTVMPHFIVGRFLVATGAAVVTAAAVFRSRGFCRRHRPGIAAAGWQSGHRSLRAGCGAGVDRSLDAGPNRQHRSRGRSCPINCPSIIVHSANYAEMALGTNISLGIRLQFQ